MAYQMGREPKTKIKNSKSWGNCRLNLGARWEGPTFCDIKTSECKTCSSRQVRPRDSGPSVHGGDVEAGLLCSAGCLLSHAQAGEGEPLREESRAPAS